MRLLREFPGLRGVAFDLDGTVYEAGALLPGASETVAAIRAAGLPVRFLTNTTSRSRAAVAERLRRLGIRAVDDEVFSPPAAAGAFLRSTDRSAHLVVAEAAREDFRDVREDDEHPDCVVLGDLGEAWTFARLNRAFQLVQEAGADLLALGRTRYWQTATGLQLDTGAFVAALEYATGRVARVFGKPDAGFFRAIVESLGCPADAVVVVGDDVLTDVGGAMAAGLRGVLVETGKFRPGDLDRGVVPDLVLGGIGALV